MSYEKDPSAKLDYVWDWTLDLVAGDYISAATVSVSAGITLDLVTFTGTSVIAWIEGGQAGIPYTATAHITTAGGRIDERTITISVKQK